MLKPSDLFLSPDLTESEARAYLQSLGFRDAVAADGHLQRMADDLVAREALGRLAPDLIGALVESPDCDAALAAIAQYLTARSGRGMFLDYLREDPRALHVLTYVMGASPHLAEILVRTPEYFHWLVSQIERTAPDRQDHEEELVSALLTLDDPADALDLLRRWKRRETLRIGARYLLHHETVQSASAQLSDVAAVIIDLALAIIVRQTLDAEGLEKVPGAFAVISTGALGSFEMSYVPDIDLLYVYDETGAAGAGRARAAGFFERVGCDLTDALRDDTRDGTLYHVSAPLWPEMEGALKACSLAEYARHYQDPPATAERLMLARARPIAGDNELGNRFMRLCEPFVYGQRYPGVAGSDVSTVELITQMLQLRHGARHPALRNAGTRGALEALGRAGLMDEDLCRELDRAYVFLQSAEHRRQLGMKEDQPRQIEASRERVRSLVRAIQV